MSREKQIEEMAEVYDKARLKARETLGSMNEGEAMWYSKEFYEAGYRKQEWISVDERLPEENGRYLVYVSIRHLVFEGLTMVVIVGYNKTNGFDVVIGEETVTHWMPLPEPPKMKGGAE